MTLYAAKPYENHSNSNIYPIINEDNGESFRLQQICNIKDTISKNLEHHERVRKKYAKSRSILNKVAITSGSLSVALSAGALASALSGIGIAAALPLGIISGCSALLSTITAGISKKLSKNVTKHADIVMLAKSKLSSINDLISKALSDNKVSSEEFQLIISEADKYNEIKQTIRREAYKKTSNIKMETMKTKNELREELMKEMREKLNKVV